MHVPTIKEKLKAAYPKLKEKYGYKNVMQAPRIEKVLVSVGTGKSSRNDKKKNEFVAERLATITGQKPSVRNAKKSIAGFKLREGVPVGYAITLRGTRMYDFIDRLISLALPRSRDFQGLSPKSFDAALATVGIELPLKRMAIDIFPALNLIVSGGPKVPFVGNLTFDAAKAQLGGKGFSVEAVAVCASTPKQSGLVVDQFPGALTWAPKKALTRKPTTAPPTTRPPSPARPARP